MSDSTSAAVTVEPQEVECLPWPTVEYWGRRYLCDGFEWQCVRSVESGMFSWQPVNELRPVRVTA